ncbi:MAG TPA: GatB/YqeY domain-containing protein [Pseudobdellovibrionaceae bacterium]|nr:GatB/YqeY domain-containing protein [Pseudobdellovibrionaceae bacterium]
MSLREKIVHDMKEAMRAKDSLKLNALRMVQSAFKNREIELRPEPMSEDECITVIKKLAKQRKESIEQFQAAGRQDLADNEASELKMLEAYLPAQMSREQIEALVAQVMSETGASSIKDMGTVMKAVQAKSGGTADNKIVSEVVKAKLGGK